MQLLSHGLPINQFGGQLYTESLVGVTSFITQLYINMDYLNPQPKPARTKLKPHEYTKMKTDLWLAANKRCERCRRFLFRSQAQYHHIVSRSLGGDDSPENGEILCWKCHRLIEDGLL